MATDFLWNRLLIIGRWAERSVLFAGRTKFVLHRKYSREIILFSCIELNLGGNTNNGEVRLCKIEYYIISQTNEFVNGLLKNIFKKL